MIVTEKIPPSPTSPHDTFDILGIAGAHQRRGVPVEQVDTVESGGRGDPVDLVDQLRNLVLDGLAVPAGQRAIGRLDGELADAV